MRRLVGWAALLLAVTVPRAALAQTTSDIPPPARFMVDENGIDLARGEHLVTVTDVSIGPPGPGSLAYTRQLRRTGQNNSYDMGLFVTGSSWTATAGLRSYRFTLSGSTFSSTDGGSATLVAISGGHRLTTPNGTQVEYGYTVHTAEDVNRVARATSLLYPSGDRTLLHWVSEQYCSNGAPDCSGATLITLVRLQAVSSSIGYQLHFNYGRATADDAGEAVEWNRLDSINAINTLVDSCNPTAHSCTYSRTWPTASYSGNNVTDPEGRVSSYTTSGDTFRIRHPGSASDNFTYNYSGDRIASVVRNGLLWTYGYTPLADTATTVVTDPAGHRLTIVADLDVGLPTSVSDDLGFTITYQYDDQGRLAVATAPEGNSIQYVYDARGNVEQTRIVAKPNSGTPTITLAAQYPDICANPLTCNQPQSMTDGNANTTEYEYDEVHGGITRATRPSPDGGPVRPETRYFYSTFPITGAPSVRRMTLISACQTLSSCNGQPDEAETEIAYAHPNLLASGVTHRNGSLTLSATTSFGYDAIGNTTHVNSPLAGGDDIMITRYNLAREVTAVITPDPDGGGPLEFRARRFTRDASTGLVTRVESGTIDDPSDTSWTTFDSLDRIDIAYDQWRRPIRHTLIGEDGVMYARRQTSYDSEGLVECQAVRMNPDDFSGLPPSACIQSDLGGFGRDRITRTTYDEHHRVRDITTAHNTGAATLEAAYAYRSNGRISTITDANGNRTTYTYDGHDRMRQIRYPVPVTPVPPDPPVSSTTDYEQFGYDQNGNIVSFRNRSNRTALFEYDALNRLIRHDRYNASDITYTYDLLGRMLSATHGSLAVGFTWDALGRKTSETGPLGTVISQYDLAGRRTRVTYPGGFFLDYEYLWTGEMSQVKASGSTVLATYAYDDLGRRASFTRGSGVVTSYDYDEGPWLRSMSHDPAGTAYDLTLGFSYNPAGQIVSTTRSDDSYSFTGYANGTVADTHDGRNQLVTTGGSAVDHNSRGDIITLPTPGSPAGNETEYTYSDEDRMVTAEVGVTLTYDPLGRLYQVSRPGESRRFVYDGSSVIQEYDADGNNDHRYVHGAGIDDLIAWDDRSLYPTVTRRYAHADERGSVIAYSDNSDAVTHVNRYDEYGRPQDASVAGGYGFTGQMWVPELGMYYYRARLYNPNLGRFMQPDPVGDAGGMNRYAYVGGDPVNMVDPLGLSVAPIPDEYPDRACTDGCPPPEQDHPGVFVFGRLIETAMLQVTTDGFPNQGISDRRGWAPGDEEPQENRCPAAGIELEVDGNEVTIRANIQFLGDGANAATNAAYLSWITQVWTRSVGGYSVRAQLGEGPGGIVAHISAGHLGRPEAQLGGSNIYLNNLEGGNEFHRAANLRWGGHEFGHPLGLINRYSPTLGGHTPGYGDSIMANSFAPPTARTIQDLIEIARRCSQ